MIEHMLWTEKYRPKKIEDCILPLSIKKELKSFIDSGSTPNLLFAGLPGTGKTTCAKALCNELDWDYLVINGSTDGNIDTLRTDVLSFASSMSLQSNRKCVIFDEADGLTAQMQNGFRNFIEEFAKNCSFILTCNHKNKIIEAIRDSRMANIDFVYPNLKTQSKDAEKIIAKFFMRVSEILKNEQVVFDELVVFEIIKKYYPDFRRTLNELQKFSRTGSLDASALALAVDINFSELEKYLKAKDFTKMRKWVALNLNNDQVSILSDFYHYSENSIESKQLAALVLIISKYIYQSAFSIDAEINLTAAFTEMMLEVY